MRTRQLLTTLLLAALTLTAGAQRVTDKLPRGLVAIPQGDKTGQDERYGMSGSGIFVSWRKLPAEYFDTKYNLYRNGSKVAENIEVTNYQDNSGTKTSTYKVVPVINGTERNDLASEEVTPWEHQYWDINVQNVINRNGADVTSGYTLNDCSVADVDGDGQMEFVVKRRNDSGNLNTTGNTTDFNLHECYKMDGTRLWWIDMGPNLMAGPDEQFDLILYDWDGDGKAEALMRGADNMIIHTATGKTINIGNMNYYAPRYEYTRDGAEYLLYINGETGEPYGWDGSANWTPMAYPLPRYEQGESDYAAVWGTNDTGHRSCKHYFGAPYLDGRNASIFLGRGCYTRHKFCALDVNPTTHELKQRWRWNCYDSKSPWFGNGFHNFAIADVDMDGWDEIEIVWSNCETLMRSILKKMAKISKKTEEINEETQDDSTDELNAMYIGLHDQLEEIHDSIEAMIMSPDPNYIYWTDLSGSNSRLSLCTAPLSVGSRCRPVLTNSIKF